MIIFIYTVLVFLVLRFSVTLFNFLSNPKIGNYRRHFTDKVSIIIRAAGSTDISGLLASIETQDYENLEVIVQQDGDHAHASGRYLLFLDADTRVQRGFINSLIYRMQVFKLTVLTVVPTQRHHSFLAWCCYPLSEFVLLNIFPLRLVRLISSPMFSAAADSCIFIEGASNQQYQWDKLLQDPSFTAADLVKQVKQEKLKADILLGNNLIVVENRMEKQVLSAYTSRLMTNFNNYPMVALVYVLLVVIGPVFLGLELAPVFLILPFGLIFLTRIMISFLGRQQPVYQLFLHPFQMIALVFLVIRNVMSRIYRRLMFKK